MSWLRTLLPRRVPPEPSTAVIPEPEKKIKRRRRKHRVVVVVIRYHPGIFYDLVDCEKETGVLDLETKPSIILLFGKSESGKSTIVRSIFWCYAKARYFVFGIVLSPTAKYNGDYRWMPKSEIHEPDERILLKHLRKLLGMWHAGVKIPPNFIVLEDCTGLIGESKALSREFKNFITIYRHLNCSIIMPTHHYTGSATIFRNNVTHAFLCMSNDQNNDKQLHKSFGKYLPKPYNVYSSYEEWIAERMVDHRALLFINDLHKPHYHWYRSVNAPKTGWRLYNEDSTDSGSDEESLA